MKNISIKININNNSTNEIEESDDIKHDRKIVQEASHISFLLNRITNHDNIIIEQVRKLQCEQKRIQLAQARTIAYYDGWAAAKYLGFPECTRIISTGDIAQVETCKNRTVIFETIVTKCSPQPIFNNFTIDVNGYALVARDALANVPGKATGRVADGLRTVKCLHRF